MDIETTFTDSYERVIGEGVGITEGGRAFFHRFYENFLASSVQVQEKFHDTDMDRQELVLQKGLYHLISFYLMKTDNEFLKGIAISHDRHHYNIEPELYDLWLDALLKTVEEMDPECNNDLKLAWQIVMAPGILYMKHFYDAPAHLED